jgi:hypothetical protein
MAPAPSYPQTLSQPSASPPTFNYSNPNVHINMTNAALRSTNSVNRPPRSAGGISLEGSETGSITEEDYTTALPAWSSKEKDRKDKDKDRKERGLRGVLPFPRKRNTKDKDKEKSKDKDKGKDRDRSADRNGRGGSALGEYANMGSLRGKSSKDKDKDEEF